jgi:hypothetical protein
MLPLAVKASVGGIRAWRGVTRCRKFAVSVREFAQVGWADGSHTRCDALQYDVNDRPATAELPDDRNTSTRKLDVKSGETLRPVEFREERQEGLQRSVLKLYTGKIRVKSADPLRVEDCI